jgi:hypothetical protein
MCPTKVVFPESARELAERWGRQEWPVVFNVHVVPEEVDHRIVAFTPDFDSGNLELKSVLLRIA